MFVIILIKVVLPAPFGPSKPKMRPASIESEISSLATCLPNRFVTCCIDSITLSYDAVWKRATRIAYLVLRNFEHFLAMKARTVGVDFTTDSENYMRAFGEIWRSNIFQKWVMAITGLLLVLFLIGHVSGNLLVFLGAEHMNAYGHELRAMLHGSAIWIVRFGLLIAFLFHVWSAIRLSARNRGARKKRYKKVDSSTSTMASRSMALSGLLILAYTVYHLAHFTLGNVHPEFFAGQAGWEYTLLDGSVVPDVYKMVVHSFTEPVITATYVVAMIVLGLHLNHAIASAAQTLGLTNRRLVPIVRFAGPLLSIGLVLGFCSVPLAIIAGIVY